MADTPTREPWIIIMPESKLWIGEFKCFHEANRYWRVHLKADEAWIPARGTYTPPEGWDGWYQLETAPNMFRGKEQR